MARLLGATRLSHDTEVSTSIERQREAITAYARAHDHTLVAITEDTDTSGSIAPSERPELGPWLSNDSAWDILIVAKLDRISRSLIDFAGLLEWCQARGKTIVSVSESLDFGTPTGQFVGKILILFAEFERQMMRERRADAARKLYSKGGYNGGGSLPWGYRTIRRSGRIELEPDPDLVPVITQIAEAVIAAESVQSVARRFGLDHASLLRRLRSPSLKGLVTHQNTVIRDEDGMPLMREPILPAAIWTRLQGRLDANSKGAGVPRDASPWLHVIACRECGRDLYRQRYSKRPSYSYYNHKPALKQYTRDGAEYCRCSFRAADIEAQIEPIVLLAFGDKYFPEVIDLPGEDHSDELAQVEEAIADLEADRYERHLFRGAAGAQRYAAMMERLETRAEALRAQPKVPPRREIVLSDDLFSERWEALESDRERGALLRRMRVRIFAFEDKQDRTRLQLRQGGGHGRVFGSAQRKGTRPSEDLDGAS
jgi:site-specific DNA recombinase